MTGFEWPLWPLSGAPIVVPGSYLTPPDNNGTIGSASAAETTNSYSTALQTSYDRSNGGVPATGWNDDWNALVDLTPDGSVTTPIDDGRHIIPLSGGNVTERDFQQANEDDPSLRAALKASHPRYHKGLEIMRENYTPPEGGPSEMDQISLAVHAGYAALRPDILDYTKLDIKRWLVFGLWPYVDDSQSDDSCQECSKEVTRLNTLTQSEATTMQRRVVRMRLYHWYMKLQNELKSPEKRPALRPGEKITTKAINMILEKSHPDWKNASDAEKKSYRVKFHRNKEVGLKWCTLVQYLGAGIAVICGKEMDSIINDTKFNLKSVHTLATFVRNFYPDVPRICRLFDFPLKLFIQDMKVEDEKYRDWQGSLEQDIATVKKGLEGPQVPPGLPSAWIDPNYLEAELTGFVRRALENRT
ncbi:hypothetical protein BJX96DRAFT_180233 [Aspergillus floccosus]